MLLADALQPQLVAQQCPQPAINVDCLAAIIEGTLRVAPDTPIDRMAAHIASVYKGFVDNGLITADGKQGAGNLKSVA